jgi:flagellar motor switch protein FliM
MSKTAPTFSAPRGILEDDPQRIRLFDFSRQETIERGRLRLLRPALETVAGRFASTLSSGVRQIVRASIAEDFIQQSWEEYAPSLPDPTFIATSMLSPFERRFVLHLPVPLALLILDYHLGGDGSNEPEREEISDIEQALIQSVIEHLWRDAIVPPLSNYLHLSVGSMQSSNNPIFIQVGRPGEICLIVELEVSVADSEPYTVVLAGPVSAVNPIIDSIERAHSGEATETGGVASAQVEANLQHVAVEMKVSYPSVRFTPAELADLEPGDVLPLRPRTEVGLDLLQILVDETVFAQGVLVEEGRNLAVSITSLEESIQ